MAARAVPPTVQRGSAIFDLAFTIVDSAGPLRGMIEFSTQLFDNATIARLAAHYRLLLGAVVADPDVRLADIGFLTRPERDLLVAQRIPSPPRIDAITDAVSASVRSTPEAIAVVADDGRLDFRHLDARAGAVARPTRASSGFGPGIWSRCSPTARRGSRQRCSGCTASARRTSRSTRSSPANGSSSCSPTPAPRAIIAGAIDVLPTAGPPVVRLDELDELDGVVGAPNVPSGSGAASPAYVLYTSGSSGVPKGVVIPRSALENHMAWMLSEFEFGPARPGAATNDTDLRRVGVGVLGSDDGRSTARAARHRRQARPGRDRGGRTAPPDHGAAGRARPAAGAARRA